MFPWAFIIWLLTVLLISGKTAQTIFIGDDLTASRKQMNYEYFLNTYCLLSFS